MRTNEERIAALHRQTAELNRAKRNCAFAAVCTVSAAVSISILTGMSVLFPKISEDIAAENAADSMQASILSSSSLQGCIVIAILAFLLGITVTVLCFHLKRWMDRKNGEDPQ